MKTILFLWAIIALAIVKGDDNTDDPWAQDDTDSQVPDLGTTQTQVSAQELIENDNAHLQLIMNNTAHMAKTLGLCDQIVVAAYKVSDYEPPNVNGDHKDFWKKQVNPNLVQSLVQDVKGRDILEKSFSTITELSIMLQNGGRLLQQDKGSKAAIRVVKNNFKKVMNKIDQCIKEVESLESSAMESFANQTEKIFDIIGPEAAKFSKRKIEIETNLASQFKKRENVLYEITDKQGDLSRISALMTATQKQLDASQEQLNEEKERTSYLKKLNDAVEWNIRNIPDKVTVTEKVSHSCFWFIHWNTYRTREELNPYREIDHDYYDKVIRARLSRISIQEDKENKKKAILKELNDYMSDLKGQFNRTAGQLQVLQDELPSKIGVIDGQIDLALKQIEQLNKDEKDIENKVGLEGNTLVKCLSDVKLFGKTLHGGATAYSPLASVMNEVKDIVQIDFDLLETGETPDVYLASSNLLHRVKFLNKLALGSQKMFQVSADYKKITDSQEFKTLALEYSA